MVSRVRELEIRYKAVRGTLPTSGRVSTPQDAARLASTLLADSTVEKCLALHLDTKHGLIGLQVVSVGCLDATVVHPREVFQGALLSNAAGLIFVHNHPSGDPTPSQDDRDLVKRLRQAGEILGVSLIDALIVTDPADGLRYFSFQEQGVLS